MVKFHLFGWRRRWKTLTRSQTDKRISPKPPPPFGGGQLVHHLCTQVKCEPPPDHGIMTYILQRGHAVVSIAAPAAAAGAETFTSSPSSVISRTPSCGGARPAARRAASAAGGRGRRRQPWPSRGAPQRRARPRRAGAPRRLRRHVRLAVDAHHRCAPEIDANVHENKFINVRPCLRGNFLQKF